MKIKNIQRRDAIKLDANDLTYFTKEGYLVDHPIVTRIGIFEYVNPDGTIHKEFRPPEEVFDKESLASYEGKPVIITHDAGYVTKENVSDEEIGTILGAGYQDGENVRAKIIIHDTDSMKEAGLKELSLGYNLDLDETEGEYNGEHYDAIQRNIRINHLALVSDARAGEQARLNIDSKENKISQGGKVMRRFTRNDEGPMSSEELAKAIEAFKERKAERMAEKQANTADEDDKPIDDIDLSKQDDEEMEAVKEVADEDAPVVPEKKEDEENLTPEEKVQMVKDRRDRRDEEDEPKDEVAMKIIADQDEDIETLLDVIDEMSAEKDMKAKDEDDTDESKSEAKADDDEEEEKPMNADSVDRIISQKLKVCRIGDKLNLDGLEAMSLMAAKKAIIKKVEPSIRLDGKSKAYINAAYDIACQKVSKRKDTNYQRSQMFNGVHMDSSAKPQALSARERMIARREGGNE